MKLGITGHHGNRMDGVDFEVWPKFLPPTGGEARSQRGGLGARLWLVAKLRLGSRSLDTCSAAVSYLGCG